MVLELGQDDESFGGTDVVFLGLLSKRSHFGEESKPKRIDERDPLIVQLRVCEKKKNGGDPMDGESRTNAVPRPIKLAAIFLLLWMFLGLVSMFSRFFGYGYLPSTSYLNETASLRIALGLIGAVVVTISSIKNIDIENGELRKILAALTSPCH